MKELKHKGYFGSADIDVESGMIVGRLLFISDVIGYSGATVPELKAAFEEAVDDRPLQPPDGSFRERRVIIAGRRVERGRSFWVKFRGHRG